MIPRRAQSTLEDLPSGYPVVGITGPRQSGKTTLARAVFAQHPYVSLEDPDQREFAEDDPRGFLNHYADGAILDEVQRCPELFSWLQGRVDADPEPGRWVLTGSQQFGMLSSVTQSLAGRIALLTLLPLTLDELQMGNASPDGPDEWLWRGGFPPIHDRMLDPSRWFGNYVQTYLERDVRQILRVREFSAFQRFLRLCAGRTGQLLNHSALADETGVSHNTIREWVTVLEASGIVHRLPPHARNFNKRLVKTPKLYFTDAGLAAWLLGVESPGQLSTHPLRGALFETAVISEFLKGRFNQARPSNLFFWRDQRGHEIDLLREGAGLLQPIEIKSGATVRPDAFRGLERWQRLAGDATTDPLLVYGGTGSRRQNQVDVIGWAELPKAIGSGSAP